MKRPRFQLHFTPTSASWLNLVERWFALLTEQQLRRGVFRSTRNLETTIRNYIAAHNEAPKPFIWTKTADEILASVARFCQRTLETGHEHADNSPVASLRNPPINLSHTLLWELWKCREWCDNF